MDRFRDELFATLHLGLFRRSPIQIGRLRLGAAQASCRGTRAVLRHVIAVDASAAMLQVPERYRTRKRRAPPRDLEALPIDDARLDAATLALVLHHVPEPGRALADVARVLKPRGRLLIVDMLPHDREGYRQQMGHIWLGFSDEHVRRILDESGFGDVRIVPLSPDPKSKGPGLFVATAKRLN